MPFKDLVTQRAYRKANKEKLQKQESAYFANYRATHKNELIKYRKQNREAAYFNAARTRYGVTVEEYTVMHAKQDGRCAICREPKKLHIDHDHVTKRFRGLLCMTCNTAIGKLKDDPEVIKRALTYVEGQLG